MSMTTLLGLSFGVFPCLLFGFIMLLSLLICEYIEEYVAKHLCAWKNRRRRGLRSFYHDFRARGDSHNMGAVQHYTSRSRSYSTAWVSGDGGSGEMMAIPDGNTSFPATAPPPERPVHYSAAAQISYHSVPMLPANDPPPSYEECVLPRIRRNSTNSNGNAISPQPNKPSLKKSSSNEKEK